MNWGWHEGGGVMTEFLVQKCYWLIKLFFFLSLVLLFCLILSFCSFFLFFFVLSFFLSFFLFLYYHYILFYIIWFYSISFRTAPGVCSRCVCVHVGWVNCRAQILSMGNHTWPHVTSLSLFTFVTFSLFYLILFSNLSNIATKPWVKSDELRVTWGWVDDDIIFSVKYY